MDDLRQELRSTLTGRVCLLGLGNVESGDDGFGVCLAEQLLAAGVSDVIVAGTEPERCLAQVADGKFDHVLFLDAVDFGGPPGSVALLDAARIAVCFPQVSTHKISLAALAKALEAAGTQTWLLGAQPQSLRPGRLTPVMEDTIASLTELLVVLKKFPPPQPAPAPTPSGAAPC